MTERVLVRPSLSPLEPSHESNSVLILMSSEGQDADR